MSRTITPAGTVVYGADGKLERHAVIENGVVVNVIVVDAEPSEHGQVSTIDAIKHLEKTERIDVLEREPQVGWKYDGKDFSAPEKREE